MKYGEWLEEWLENYIKPMSKTKTYADYRFLVQKHIIPALGEYECRELTILEIQRYITKLSLSGNLVTGKGLSSNSVNLIISVIQGSVKTARNIGYIDSFASDQIKRLKSREKKVDSFTVEEQKKLEQYILNSKPQYLGIILSLYTGVRIGELLALEWEDIDLVGGFISINKACHYGRDKEGVYRRITETPKTDASIRTIPIPEQLIPLLTAAKEKSRSIFLVSNGEKSISTRSYQNSFRLLLKKIELPHKGFHALRHTFATRALECGMDVKTLSDILGHRSPVITLNRYVHSLDKHKKEMMNRLGNLL